MRLIPTTLRKIGAPRAALAFVAALAVLGGCAARPARPDRRPPPAAVHQVRPGDSLESIAAGYGVSTDRLARANRLERGDRLAAGQRLRIPDAARIVHQVRRGESVQQIARRYRVRVSTIAYLNRLGRFPQLEPGQRLILPRDATLPAPAAAREPPAVAAPGPKPPAAPRATDPNTERARALVDGSFDDYRAARFERALERSREAETLLANSEGRSARSLAARAVFVSGSSLAALGETDRAKEAFARVHALDPEFEPPKGWLSPRLEALYLAGRPD